MTEPSMTGEPAGVGDQIRQAKIFASLHKRDDPLLPANSWDVASAVAIADAGAKAIATTSAGVAWSLGLRGAADLGADHSAAVTGRIAAAVQVPVSADIEAGYGPAPDAVAATVTTVIQAGAVGLNLEDRAGRHDTPLFEPAEQAERLAAARAAADRLAVPAWINARTDVFITGTGRVEDRLEAALQRAAAYARPRAQTACSYLA
jgi:2-methylisocitrate lyase-like PEP mutase family enzyme